MTEPIERAEQWAASRPARVRGHNPSLLIVRVARRFKEVRVPGLAAEMTYYALISLIPFVVAVGASLGLLEGFIGPAQVLEVENTIISAIDRIFSEEFVEDVLDPLVRGLLAEERTGVALLSLLFTFLFASAGFRAAIRALDDAYRVPERRGAVHVWSLAYVLALGSVLVVIFVLTFLVVGPLLGGGQQIGEWLGLGRTFELIWEVGRWPVVFAVAIAYLALLYRTGPNVENRWSECLPGAALATVLAVLVTVVLQVYLAVAGPRAPQVGDAQEAVQIASQTVGALLAVVLWIWLISIAVLTGGVFNAELQEAMPSAEKGEEA